MCLRLGIAWRGVWFPCILWLSRSLEGALPIGRSTDAIPLLIAFRWKIRGIQFVPETERSAEFVYVLYLFFEIVFFSPAYDEFVLQCS
jgi:hypothetical protein